MEVTMAKTSGEYELEFIQTAKEKTGKTLEQWLGVVKPKDFKKQMEILNWLKKEHKLNHMQAAFVAGIYLNNGKPVYQNESNLLENQFLKAEGMRSLFEHVSSGILKKFPDTKMIAKKTYVSFTVTREFVAINIKPNELRLGFDLGDEATTDILQKSKLVGPMPRISHMVIITQKDQLNKKVSEYLKQSYNRSHKK
jgi:predicted transport protein